MRVVLYKFL